MSRAECGIIGLCPVLTKDSNIKNCDECEAIRDWAEHAVRDVEVVDFEYNPRKTLWDVSDEKSTAFSEKLLPKLQLR